MVNSYLGKTMHITDICMSIYKTGSCSNENNITVMLSIKSIGYK